MDTAIIVAALFASIAAIIAAITKFVTVLFDLKAKQKQIDLEETERRNQIDLDATEKRNKLDAKDRELIQFTYGNQAEEIRLLRGSINDLNLKVERGVVLAEQKEKIIDKLHDQQELNKEKIRKLTEQGDKFDQVLSERDNLQRQISNLQTDFEKYRQDRHQADNDLAIKLGEAEYLKKQAEQDRDAALAGFRDCQEKMQLLSKDGSS